MSDWLGEIGVDELKEPYGEMARLIGIEATVRLAEYFSKQGIYFKSLNNFISEKKKRYIIKHFDGANHRELARATGYSLQYVYQILREHNACIKSTTPTLF